MQNPIALQVDRLRRRPVDLRFAAFFIGTLALCFGLQASEISIGRWGVDAETLSAAVNTRGAVGATSLGDFAVVAITPFLRLGPFPNAMATIALAFVISRIAFQGSLRERAIILYLAFPIIFQLQFVSKEAVVTIFVIGLFLVYSATRNQLLRSGACFVGLIAMAITFRNYYWIALGFSVAIFILHRSRWLIPALLAGLILASFVPQIREPLLEARYFVFHNVSEDAASLLPLHFRRYGPLDFLGNYATSVLYFIFPVFVGLRVQELYLQLYVVIALVLVITALRRGDRALAAIFLGMILTYPVFVAELGTFARHLSAIVALGVMSLFFSPLKTAVQNAPATQGRAGAASQT